MEEKLQQVLDKFAEIEQSLNDPSVVNNANRLREASREYKSLQPIVDKGLEYLKVINSIRDNRVLIADDATDADLRDLAYQDIKELEEQQEILEQALATLLIPKDPNDMKPCIMEIRAGTGGDEAAIFAGDLYAMYHRFCEVRGWKIDPIDFTESEMGGYKEITFEVDGDEAFGVLRFESGVHRVQRVPATRIARPGSHVCSNRCSATRGRRGGRTHCRKRSTYRHFPIGW